MTTDELFEKRLAQADASIAKLDQQISKICQMIQDMHDILAIHQQNFEDLSKNALSHLLN